MDKTNESHRSNVDCKVLTNQVRGTYVKTVGCLKRLQYIDNNIVDSSVAIHTGDCYDFQARIVSVFIVI